MKKPIVMVGRGRVVFDRDPALDLPMKNVDSKFSSNVKFSGSFKLQPDEGAAEIFGDMVRKKRDEMLANIDNTKTDALLAACSMTKEEAMAQRHRFQMVVCKGIETVHVDGVPVIEFHPVKFETIGTVMHAHVPYRVLRQL